MTTIRVENADPAGRKVVVQVWEQGPNNGPDVVVREHFLDNPTGMTPPDLCVSASRYLVVKEVV